MALYKVTWIIDIDAESPQEAAEEALRIQRDKDSGATFFEVLDEDGNKVEVDLTIDV